MTNCSGRFGAEAWMFASFWCVSAILLGNDDSGGAANAFLTNSQVDFRRFGARANVGMVLWNLTDGSEGPITAVTPNTLTATLAGGTDNLWDDGDAYRLVTLTAIESSAIEHALDVAAGDIYPFLASVGACDCTLATWASRFLQKMLLIETAAYYKCPCASPRFTPEQRERLFEQMNEILNQVRTGELEVCAGHTGSAYPAIGWAEMGLTEWNQAQIILNSLMRYG